MISMEARRQFPHDLGRRLGCWGLGVGGWVLGVRLSNPSDYSSALNLQIVPPNDLNAKLMGWQYMAQNGQIFGYYFDVNYNIFPLILTPGTGS
jgi:hypothetical protein